MRKYFLIIMLCFLCGCRGQRHVESTETQQYTSEIGVEFHDLQRFWNSMAERLNFKIEFYPAEGDPEKPTTDNCVPIDPNDSHIGTLPTIGGFGGSGGVGFGSVKSMEFTSEKVVSDSSLSHTDSTAVCKTESESDAHTEKASELRQDNGTWTILAVVAAVVIIVLVLIVIKKFFKK